MRYDYVFFDWNGTLIDDAKPSADAVNVMFEKRNLPLISLDEYRRLVDIPIENFYKKTMDMEKETMDNLSVEFNREYEKFLTDNSVLPSTRKTLDLLRQNAVKLFIFSSSATSIIQPKLKRYFIDKYFDAVLGSGDCYVMSKAQRTKDFVEKSGFDKRRILFVGDMVHDSEVADFVGSDCFLVTGGHQPEDILVKTKKTVIHSLTELPKIIGI